SPRTLTENLVASLVEVGRVPASEAAAMTTAVLNAAGIEVLFRFLRITRAEIEPPRHNGRFEVRGVFALSATSNGIDVLRERVAVQLGTFNQIITAGSFGRDSHGGFIFKSKGGSGIKEMRIGRDGQFEIEGRGVNLGSI